MPELPEVETIRRALAPELANRRLRRVRIHQSDIVMDSLAPEAFARRVEGSRIESVDRRGKLLLLRLAGAAGTRVLQVQLRMTGRFGLASGGPDPSLAHIAAEFDLEDGRTLYYDDVRRLGGFRLLSVSEWETTERELGPEPLSPAFTARRLEAVLRGARAPIKNALLDQRRIAGIGNIYASEALHAARLDPRRAAGTLSPGAVRRLHRAIRRVLREAIEAAGTTLRDYRSLDGGEGSFQNRLRVYGRADEPCHRCRRLVVRIVQAGRSSYLCPACQS